MSGLQNTVFRVGAWCVDPASGEMTSDGNTIRMEARTVRLLAYMVSRVGEVVSIDDLLENVWTGVMVTQDSVYQAIASLRRSLGDNPKQPTYIVTVPRLGYRLIAEVGVADAAVQSPSDAEPEQAEAPAGVISGPGVPIASVKPRKFWSKPATLSGALIAIMIGSLLWVASTNFTGVVPATAKADAPPAIAARTIAVLPFLDLTDEMNEEPFADGMSEELIGKLSKVSGLAVSPPTSSFYFKNKQVTIADISKALHVAYVLDGSVRKSGATLRVAARLTRAQDGYVIWSETYDRNWSDKLMIQDDIASEVAKALATSLH